jgi:SH3 domain
MQQQKLRGVDSWRRADVWALGCTVLEMLNGTADASTDADLSHSSPLLQFTTACSDFVQLCMQTEPADRPSALQLLQHSFVAAPSTCSSYGSGSYSNCSYTGDSLQRLAHSFDSPNSGADAALYFSSDSSKLQQHYSSNCSNRISNSNSSSSGRAPASDLQVPSPVILYSTAVPARRHCWTDASSVADAITAAGVTDIGSSPGSAFASSSSDDCAAEHIVLADTSVAPLSRTTAQQRYASTRLLRPRALSLPRLLSNSTTTLRTSDALLLSSSAHATASELATQASNSSSSSSTSAATGRTQSLPSLLFKRRVHTVSTSPVSVASGLVSPNDDDDSSSAPAAVALDCSEKLYESVGRVRARRHSAPTASITSSGTSPQWWLHQSDAAVEATCSTHTALQQQQQQQQQPSNCHSNSAAIAAATTAGVQQEMRQQRRRTSWTAGTVHSGTSTTRTSSVQLSNSMTSRSAQASPDARLNGWSVTVKKAGLPPPVPLNTPANTSQLLSASASGSVMRLVSPRIHVQQAQHTSSRSGGSSSSSGKRGRSPSHDSSMPVLLRATYPAAKLPARGSSVSARSTITVKAIDSSAGVTCSVPSTDSNSDSSTRRVMNRSRSVDELTRAPPRQLASSSSFSSSSATASYSHASMTAAIAQSWLTAARTSLAVRLQRRLDRGLPVSDECLAWLSDEHEQHHSLQLQRCEQRHLQATAAATTTTAVGTDTTAAQRGRKQRRTWSPDDKLELSTVSSSMNYRRTHSSGWCNSTSSAATTTGGGAVASTSCDADLMLLEEGLLPLRSDSMHSMQQQQQQQQQQLCADSSSDCHSESINQHQQQQQQQQQQHDDEAIECLSVSSCASVSDVADAVHSDSNSVSSSCSSSSSVSCDDAVVPEVRAVADYQGEDASELSFKAGDIIEVLQETDSGWWLGVLVEHATPANHNAPNAVACDETRGTDCAVVHSTSSTAIGTRGFFPCTFVEWLES